MPDREQIRRLDLAAKECAETDGYPCDKCQRKKVCAGLCMQGKEWYFDTSTKLKREIEIHLRNITKKWEKMPKLKRRMLEKELYDRLVLAVKYEREEGQGET